MRWWWCSSAKGVLWLQLHACTFDAMQVRESDKIRTSLTDSDTTVTARDAYTQLSDRLLPAIIQSRQTVGGSCRNKFTEISTAEKEQYHCFIEQADHLHVVILAV